jgi:hypothetical protein
VTAPIFKKDLRSMGFFMANSEVSVTVQQQQI